MLIKQIVHGKKHNTYWGVSRFLEIMFTFGVVAVCKEWWSSDHGKLAHAMTHVDDTFKWATLSNKNSSIKVGHTKLRAPFEVSILNRRNSDIVQFGNPNIGEEEWKLFSFKVATSSSCGLGLTPQMSKISYPGFKMSYREL